MQNLYTLFCSVILKRGAVDFGVARSSRNKSLLPCLALFSASFGLNEAFFLRLQQKQLVRAPDITHFVREI